MIDLHLHSVFSDGTLTPAELVEQAAALGLRAIALTDHDTTEGVAPFMTAGAGREAADGGGGGPECVPGVEISAQVDRGTMHVLGYWIDPDAEPLQRALRDLREGRAERNRRLLKRLADLRLPVSREEVEARAGCGVVGRPHVAAVMVDRGHVRTRQEAFKRYLGKGRPGYVERYRLSPAESVAVIRAAGGVPVLAHPSTLELQGKALEREVAALREQGLEGIEVYHAEHSPEQVRRYLRLAGRLDLVPSGGSDFHGEANPVLRMGVGFGELCVEDFHLENLRARKGAAANRKTG